MYKIQNPKIYSNTNQKYYDLEERTLVFAEKCRDFIKKVPKSLSNFEYSKQLIRSSGSQAGNYIEANETVSKKDFAHRMRICRKEAKESRLWLRLIEVEKEGQINIEHRNLIQESVELTKIFASILGKAK
jgi:four helix bundle protein